MHFNRTYELHLLTNNAISRRTNELMQRHLRQWSNLTMYCVSRNRRSAVAFEHEKNLSFFFSFSWD